MRFDRSARSLGGPRSWARWASCTIVASAALASCGGRAADSLDPEASPPRISAPGVSPPGNEPTPIGPVRETCEDNPLLAGCPYSAGGDPTPPDEPVEIPEEESIYLAAARNILVSYCGACHGSQLTRAQASGGINYIDDWDQLIEAGLIQACSPRRSRIIQVMRTGQMPPPSSGLPPVLDTEVDFVAQAIELDCNSP